MKRMRDVMKKAYNLTKSDKIQKEYEDDLFPSYKSIQIGKRYYLEEEIETLFNPNETVETTEHVSLFKKIFQTLYQITRTSDGLPKKPRREEELKTVLYGLKRRHTSLKFEIMRKLQDSGDSISLRQEIQHLQDINEIITHFEEETTSTFPYDQLQIYIENPDISKSSDFDEEMNKLKIRGKENVRIRNILRQFAVLYLQNPYSSEFELYDPGISKAKFENFLESSNKQKSIPVFLGNFIRFLRNDKDLFAKLSTDDAEQLDLLLDDIKTKLDSIETVDDIDEPTLIAFIEKLNKISQSTTEQASELPTEQASELPTEQASELPTPDETSQQGGDVQKLKTKTEDIKQKIDTIEKILKNERKKYKEDIGLAQSKFAILEQQSITCELKVKDLKAKIVERETELATVRNDLENKQKEKGAVESRLKQIKNIIDPEGTNELETTLLEGKINGLTAQIKELGQLVNTANEAKTTAENAAIAAVAATDALRAQAQAAKETDDEQIRKLLAQKEETEARLADISENLASEKANRALDLEKITKLTSEKADLNDQLVSERRAKEEGLGELRTQLEQDTARRLEELKTTNLAAVSAAATAAAALAASKETELTATKSQLENLSQTITQLQGDKEQLNKKISFLKQFFGEITTAANITSKDTIEEIYSSLMSIIADSIEATTDEEKDLLNQTVQAIKQSLINAYNKEREIAELNERNKADLANAQREAAEQFARQALENAAELEGIRKEAASELEKVKREAVSSASTAKNASNSAAARKAKEFETVLLERQAKFDADLEEARAAETDARQRAEAARSELEELRSSTESTIKSIRDEAAQKIAELEAKLKQLNVPESNGSNKRSNFAGLPTSPSQRGFKDIYQPVEPPVQPVQPVQSLKDVYQIARNILNNSTINTYLQNYMTNNDSLYNLLRALDEAGLFSMEITSNLAVKKMTGIQTQDEKEMAKKLKELRDYLNSILNIPPYTHNSTRFKIDINEYTLKYILAKNTQYLEQLKSRTIDLISLLKKFKMESLQRASANPRIYRGGDLKTVSMNIANDRFDDNFLEETNPFYHLIEDFNKSTKMNVFENANEEIMMSMFLDKFLKEYFETNEMKEFYYQTSLIVNKKSCDKVSALCFQLLDVCHSIKEADKDIDVVRLDNITLNADFDMLETLIKEHEYDFFEHAKKQFPENKEISIKFHKDHLYFYLETNKFDKMYSIDEKKELHLQNFEYNEEIYYINNHLLFLFYIISNKIQINKKYNALDSYVRKTKRSKTKRMSTLLKERKLNTVDDRD